MIKAFSSIKMTKEQFEEIIRLHGFHVDIEVRHRKERGKDTSDILDVIESANRHFWLAFNAKADKDTKLFTLEE